MSIKKKIINLPPSPLKQDLVNAFSKILTDEPSKILYDVSKPYMVYQKEDKEDIELGFSISKEQEIYTIIRQKEIIECDFDFTNLNNLLFFMYISLYKKGLIPEYLLCNNKKNFLNILEISEYSNIELFLGSYLYEYVEIPEDVILLSGVKNKFAQPKDIVITMKGTL